MERQSITWPADQAAAVALQREPAPRVVHAWSGQQVRLVAGIDISANDRTGLARAAVVALDLSDDRWADLLRTLTDDAVWCGCERALGRPVLWVYDLRRTRVRVDTTTASGYGQVTEDGLFQFGHSKDQRPDLPQVKVLLATLDPLGLPVVTTVVSGEHADDPLYRPAIAQVRSTLDQRGLLYVGDCTMGALDTRAAVAAAGDYDLCPLAVTPAPTVGRIAPSRSRSLSDPMIRDCAPQRLRDHGLPATFGAHGEERHVCAAPHVASCVADLRNAVTDPDGAGLRTVIGGVTSIQVRRAIGATAARW